MSFNLLLLFSFILILRTLHFLNRGRPGKGASKMENKTVIDDEESRFIKMGEFYTNFTLHQDA